MVFRVHGLEHGISDTVQRVDQCGAILDGRDCEQEKRLAVGRARELPVEIVREVRPQRAHVTRPKILDEAVQDEAPPIVNERLIPPLDGDAGRGVANRGEDRG